MWRMWPRTSKGITVTSSSHWLEPKVPLRIRRPFLYLGSGQDSSLNDRAFEPVPRGHGSMGHPIIHRQPALHLIEDQVTVAATCARNIRLGTFSADDQSWRAINIGGGYDNRQP